MPQRTYPKDATKIHSASDLEDVVVDKRAHWRANNAKARRRQRRYKKKVVTHLVNELYINEEFDQ
ncbi:hypothetical protein CW735_14000 [Alteromonas sp. MB-3u-76]|jgi:hypothetical protein|uniref:hypothetical protein n=1 Tax=Alteromonas sp. MB-3u-76 TaxID=2058133 RepID=UPI000C318610|nr:hypothetical protein [Alteromonas sp. MB-3u-76]AUC89154.1 hypothetical protein CW735_14000 [Alteromonas sp. MB-3u-76]